jgi:hypothetical protein
MPQEEPGTTAAPRPSGHGSDADGDDHGGTEQHYTRRERYADVEDDGRNERVD